MINKFQQGGKQNAIMQFVQGLAQTLQADPNQIIQIAQQNPKALEAAIQAYQQTQDIQQAAKAFADAVQQQTRVARHGAKLNYIKSLKHQCAEDEEVYYYKKGGSVGCGCKKKEDGGEVKKAGLGCFVVDKFKKMQHGGQSNINKNDTIHVNGQVKSLTGKSIKDKKKTYKPLTNEEYKKLKNSDKNKVDEKDSARGRQVAKKGMKVEKDCGGSTVIAKFKAKCGAKMKKHEQGGSLNGIPFIRQELLKMV